MPSAADGHAPHNRLGIDYADLSCRKYAGPIADIHTHVKSVAEARTFFAAADTYGIGPVVSMTPLDQVPALREAYGARLGFIAVPNWRAHERTEAFRASWVRDLATFRELGARFCKFWMAPPMRGNWGLTLEHEFLRPVIDRAMDLGFAFMTHIGDPVEWFAPGGRYGDPAQFGTKAAQYDQLEWFLEYVAPRTVIGAHFGGSIEDTGRLTRLLERYPHYMLDSSATKWIVRGVAAQPEAVRELLLRFPDRVLFGSDLVTDGKYDFDHYASRWWAHMIMWETAHRGESPIDDPDADGPPRLVGVDLPVTVLARLYWLNAVRIGLVDRQQAQGGASGGLAAADAAP
jgi:predicted TIM-barrel fold metal-dependent hydrolase